MPGLFTQEVLLYSTRYHLISIFSILQKNQLLKEQHEGLVKDIKLPRGALIALSGIKEETGLNDLKTKVINLGWDVDFVDYTFGSTTAYIRLQTENSAKEVRSFIGLPLGNFYCQLMHHSHFP